MSRFSPGLIRSQLAADLVSQDTRQAADLTTQLGTQNGVLATNLTAQLTAQTATQLASLISQLTSQDTRQLADLIAQLTAFLAVPIADSAANVDMADVLGNKNATHDGTSVIAFLHTLNEHAHMSQFLFPSLADSIPMTTTVGAWSPNAAFTEIVPAGGIANDFDLHWAVISDLPNFAEEYQVDLYSGAALSEVLYCQLAPFKDSVQTSEGSLKVQGPILPGNTRISAKVSNKSATQRTINIKLQGHNY